MSRLNKGGDEPSLSSSTYLNTDDVKVPVRAAQSGGLPKWTKLYQKVPRSHVEEELMSIAEQMSYATMVEDYAYLKGQYVVLFRILNPGRCEADAQDQALNDARSWARGEAGKKGEKSSEPMTDNQYLEFCGVGELKEGFQVKYRGRIEYGDLVWCWVCEQWEAAAGKEVGGTVKDHFTLELIDEEKPV